MLDSSHDETPVLVCADLQKRHETGERDDKAGSAGIIAACLELVTLWRERRLPVMHLRRIARPDWFDLGSELSDWIAALRPRPDEMIFEHPLPSAYSSARFSDYMSNMRDIRCIVLGCSLEETILATVVEGFHRSHRYTVIGDAVACARSSRGSRLHSRPILDAIANFAAVSDSSGLRRAARAITA